MPAPLPAEFSGKPFAVDAQGAAGVSRSRTRAKDLQAPFRGVRMPAGEPGTRELCEAYAIRMTEGQFFSHETAAVLHGLPVPSTHLLHVSTMGGAGREPRVRGIVGHRLAVGSVTVVTVGGLTIASPVSTWVMLAPYLSLVQLVILGDALVRRKHPLATTAEMIAAVGNAAGRRGHRRLSAALALVRARTDSPRETRTRLWLVWGGLPEPVVNSVIRNQFGGFLTFGDLVYEQYRVIVEYDGGQHFQEEGAISDVDRLEALMALGWRVVRINKTHSQSVAVALVRAALIQGGWRP